MAKISVYFNNASSRAKSTALKDTIGKHLFRHDLEFKSPQGIEQLEKELDKDLLESTDYIFSVGGDGTANTIVQKIQGSKIKMMVVPTGTANDFATELGLKGNIEKIIKVFLHHTFQCVDIIRVNDKYMITNGGLGIAANVAEKVNRDRKDIKGLLKLMKHTGSMIYPLYFGKEVLLDFKRYRLNIHSPNFPRLDTIVESSSVMINNQAKIGGSFNIAPATKNDDGRFNVTIFTHDNKKDYLKATTSMLRGIYPENDPNLISFETDQLDITHLGDDKLAFFGDGEILEKGQSFQISMIPSALNVCSYDESILYCNSYSLENVRLM